MVAVALIVIVYLGILALSVGAAVTTARQGYWDLCAGATLLTLIVLAVGAVVIGA